MAAGLVPLCVEKLVEEDVTELKVTILLCITFILDCIGGDYNYTEFRLHKWFMIDQECNTQPVTT